MVELRQRAREGSSIARREGAHCGDERGRRGLRCAREHPSPGGSNAYRGAPPIDWIDCSVHQALSHQSVDDVGDGAAIGERARREIVERETRSVTELLENEELGAAYSRRALRPLRVDAQYADEPANRDDRRLDRIRCWTLGWRRGCSRRHVIGCSETVTRGGWRAIATDSGNRRSAAADDHSSVARYRDNWPDPGRDSSELARRAIIWGIPRILVPILGALRPCSLAKEIKMLLSRRSSRRSIAVAAAAAALIVVAGCHHAPAVVATAKPAANADSARLARAHADSLGRALTARRAAAARAKAAADSARVVAEEKQNVSRRAKAIVLAPVLFAFDSSDLRVPERTMLDRKAAILAANHDIRLRIVGNTDERGSDEYNLALGMRRAAAAETYLAGHGIDTTRFEVISSGEEHPICRDHEEWCWSQNRRDEFVIVAGGDRIIAAR